MSKTVTLHYELKWGDQRSLDLELMDADMWEGVADMHRWDVFYEGVKVGTIDRDKNHRTHQVHNRLRYDNKPRTRYRSSVGYLGYRDTRNEALAEIMEHVLDNPDFYPGSVHLPGRGPSWRRCALCLDA